MNKNKNIIKSIDDHAVPCQTFRGSGGTYPGTGFGLMPATTCDHRDLTDLYPKTRPIRRHNTERSASKHYHAAEIGEEAGARSWHRPTAASSSIMITIEVGSAHLDKVQNDVPAAHLPQSARLTADSQSESHSMSVKTGGTAMKVLSVSRGVRVTVEDR
jgi:hypothetical protein